VPPTWSWFAWLILAGRGWGKTRTGAECVRWWVNTGRYPYVNLIGATADDARDIMIQGESGLLAICPADERPRYIKSDRLLIWPNGARSLIFTADEPERLRGKQHMKLWADEIAAWRYAESWDQAMMGLRLGDSPQAVVTTTPRPVGIVRELLADKRNHVTTGTTYENRENLSPGFFRYVITKYEGTRLGRQELRAELLGDVPGALWKRSLIEQTRVTRHPELVRIVVAVDPAATSNAESDETGIVAAGLGVDGHGYVLADRTLQGTPAEWARTAVSAYREYQADRIVGEVNNGGEMVGFTILTIDPSAAYKAVHASRGKLTRAEPVSALYERGFVHHVGAFPQLEDQMCTWLPGEDSPDRMDALVWALTELFLEADEDQAVGYDERVEISRY
jgi:phage terminase large subunit-like protein